MSFSCPSFKPDRCRQILSFTEAIKSTQEAFLSAMGLMASDDAKVWQRALKSYKEALQQLAAWKM